MFDSAIKGEFMRKSCSILSFGVFIPKKKESLQCMKQQDFKRSATKNSQWKKLLANPRSFQHFFLSTSLWVHAFNFQFFFKDFSKNQAEVVINRGGLNQLQLLSHLHQAKKMFLTEIFGISGKNIRVDFN